SWLKIIPASSIVSALFIISSLDIFQQLFRQFYLECLRSDLLQRALLAALAISRLRSALIELARDGPPTNPPLRPAAFRTLVFCSVCPEMAACTTRKARTFISMHPPQRLDG